MNNQEIKDFFKNIKKLKLSKHEKKRMLRLFQVRGSNNKNKVMTFKNFVKHINNNNGKITKLVIGPSWSRLVFVDIDIEV
tara:strand:- start:878 stop:1117 length:240 start_codon:yes stop_codon:yes gene_type:complete